MTKRKRNWLIGTALVLTLAFAVLIWAGVVMARRFEPYIREQAILYLQERFDSEV